MLSKALTWFIVAIIAVAVWGTFDGNMGAALSTVLDTIVRWVSAGAEWLQGTGIIQNLLGA